MGRHPFLWLYILLALLLPCHAGAAAAVDVDVEVDVAILSRPKGPDDHRLDYAAMLLRTVLERTRPAFGPYRIDVADTAMKRGRLLQEMQRGQRVNITPMAIDADWRATLLSVPIPIDLGLQSWRLLMIDRRSQPRLRALAAAGQLRHASAGVSASWALYRVLQAQGYRTVTGNNYDGMFLMLQAGRFDYLPRGLPEVFAEYDQLQPRFPTLAIEDSIVLHARIPTLFFVAPQARRLQQRLQAGMEAMLQDGSLERLVLAYYRPHLERARLCGRQRIEVPGTALDPAMQARAALWLDPFDPRHGLCPPLPLPVSRLRPRQAPAGAAAIAPQPGRSVDGLPLAFRDSK